MINQEIYTVAEAARLLEIHPGTLRWWLEGRGHIPPVLRTEPSGSPNVTWGEFVEARYLREYRRFRSLQQLRPVIERLRHDFGVEHPLAHVKPFVGPGWGMTLAAQQSAGLRTNLALVHEIVTGQIILSFAAADFLRLVEFDPDGDRWARRIRPEGRASPIVIDPEYSFGAPTIKGIRTEALFDLVRAGEPIDTVADDYSLTPREVSAGVAYEWRVAA